MKPKEKALSEEYHRYIESPLWTAQRLKALQRWGRKCAACGFQRDLEVHHLAYRNFVDVTTDDLMPLCRKHHELTHSLADIGSLLKKCVGSAAKRSVIIGYFAPRFALKYPRRRRSDASKLLKIHIPRSKQKNIPEEIAKRAKENEEKIAAFRKRSIEVKRARILKLGLMTCETVASASNTSLKRALRKHSKRMQYERDAIREKLRALIRADPTRNHYEA